MGLSESQDFKQLVQGTEPAGEDHQCLCQVRKPELAHEEVVELEVKRRCNVGVRILLEREPDVQANGLRTGLSGAAVCGLHDAGPAPGSNNESPPPRGNGRGPLAEQECHAPGVFVIARHVHASES